MKDWNLRKICKFSPSSQNSSNKLGRNDSKNEESDLLCNIWLHDNESVEDASKQVKTEIDKIYRYVQVTYLIKTFKLLKRIDSLATFGSCAYFIHCGNNSARSRMHSAATLDPPDHNAAALYKYHYPSYKRTHLEKKKTMLSSRQESTIKRFNIKDVVVEHLNCPPSNDFPLLLLSKVKLKVRGMAPHSSQKWKFN